MTLNGVSYQDPRNINLKGSKERGSGVLRFSQVGVTNWSASPISSNAAGLYINSAGALVYTYLGTAAAILGASAATTGSANAIVANSLTTGTGLAVSSSSVSTGAFAVIKATVSSALAVGAFPLVTSNAAVVSSHFTKQAKLGTVTLWVSDGTTPNAALTGTAGDVCFGADSGKSYYCTGTTSWTAF